MKDDPSISGKKTVEESVVESSWMWVDGVFQDGLMRSLTCVRDDSLKNKQFSKILFSPRRANMHIRRIHHTKSAFLQFTSKHFLWRNS